MRSPYVPSDDIDENIAQFFCDPKIPPKPPGYFSTLYLLRRDAAKCMGRDQNTFKPLPEEIFSQALWPGLMAVFAGIDLLAKFLRENDTSPVSERFKSYVELYICPTHPEWQESLWKLRNAVMHSFGLYGGMVRGKEERYLLTAGAGIVNIPDETPTERTIHFDILEIWKSFEEHLPAFQSWIVAHKNNPNLRVLLTKYGFTGIGVVKLEPASPSTIAVSGDVKGFPPCP